MARKEKKKVYCNVTGVKGTCMTRHNTQTNSNAYIVIVNISSNHRLTKHTAFKLQLKTIHK